MSANHPHGSHAAKQQPQPQGSTNKTSISKASAKAPVSARPVNHKLPDRRHNDSQTSNLNEYVSAINLDNMKHNHGIDSHSKSVYWDTSNQNLIDNIHKTNDRRSLHDKNTLTTSKIKVKATFQNQSVVSSKGCQSKRNVLSESKCSKPTSSQCHAFPPKTTKPPPKSICKENTLGKSKLYYMEHKQIETPKSELLVGPSLESELSVLEKLPIKIFTTSIPNLESLDNFNAAVVDEEDYSGSVAKFNQFMTSLSQTNIKTNARSKEVNEVDANEIIRSNELLEDLHDNYTDMMSAYNTIESSYENIIQSLVNLQGKQVRKRSPDSLLPPTASVMNTAKRNRRAQNDHPIDQFTDPLTRNEAFSKLSAHVNRLKGEMRSFCACFDDRGSVNMAQYTRTATITGGTYVQWQDEIDELHKTLEELIQHYNRDVLDMFRISKMG